MTPTQVDTYLESHQLNLSQAYQEAKRQGRPDTCQEINNRLTELAVIRIQIRLEHLCK